MFVFSSLRLTPSSSQTSSSSAPFVAEEDRTHALPPLPLTVATALLVLLSLSDFPFPWQYFFPGAEEPPDFIIYSGIVLGIFGLIVAVGLWLLKRWSFWATLIVAALNFPLGVPGVVEVSTPGPRAAIMAGEIVAVLVIVLVVLPASRRALAAPVA